MNSIDQSQKSKPKITNSAQSTFSSSLSNLSKSSRTIPTNKDFHFYYNFDEFKNPIHRISRKSQSLLESLGSSNKKFPFPNDLDIGDDDTYDWLVNVNDGLLERFDASIDEFKSLRKKQEEKGGTFMDMESNKNDCDGEFQVVYGKKKKGAVNVGSGESLVGSANEPSSVKVADLKAKGAKSKVPFHIHTIKKPQEQYNILVNNSNQPFEHVWFESADGMRFHPLAIHSFLDFVDQSTGSAEPVPPPSLESTPFHLVEEVKDLKQLAAKLRAVNEFSVDLEHNQYRSFQGLTCLMQISTRTEDFIVDTLKLRIHVGPHLREVFKDPTKRKVMHGADRDIIWLQRDFGIYVCNMFDTGQASRVLKLERFSLEYLLQHFCGVAANKEYQNADWRLRPLTKEMLRYAREDTHYLLYIHDLMRGLLLSKPTESETSESPLVEVYRRSYDICIQLYEKELLTETSYQHLYGVQNAGFNAQQLAIVSGLYEWRDVIARTEDEGTGYILPNKMLLEIAKQMPVTPLKLRRVLKTKLPYIERNLNAVVNVIRHAMQNSAEFEAVAQRLKEAALEKAAQQKTDVTDGTDANLETEDADIDAMEDVDAMDDNGNAVEPDSPQLKNESLKHDKNGIGPSDISKNPRDDLLGSSRKTDTAAPMGVKFSATVPVAIIQVKKKPTSAFGALLGGSSGKRRVDIVRKDKEEDKLDKITTSVNLSFHLFSGKDETAKPAVEESVPITKNPPREESPAVPATVSGAEEIIMLEENNSDEEIQEKASSETNDAEKDTKPAGFGSESEEEGEPSLSELSTSFQKCFQSMNQNIQKSEDSAGVTQLKPFDYAAARKQVRFGVGSAREPKPDDKDNSARDCVDRKKASAVESGVEKENESREFGQGKRRQAFPATGNRSATFR